MEIEVEKLTGVSSFLESREQQLLIHLCRFNVVHGRDFINFYGINE